MAAINFGKKDWDHSLQIMVTLFMDDPLNQERHAVGGHYFVKCFIKGLQNGTSLYTTDTYYELGAAQR